MSGAGKEHQLVPQGKEVSGAELYFLCFEVSKKCVFNAFWDLLVLLLQTQLNVVQYICQVQWDYNTDNFQLYFTSY